MLAIKEKEIDSYSYCGQILSLIQQISVLRRYGSLINTNPLYLPTYLVGWLPNILSIAWKGFFILKDINSLHSLMPIYQENTSYYSSSYHWYNPIRFSSWTRRRRRRRRRRRHVPTMIPSPDPQLQSLFASNVCFVLIYFEKWGRTYGNMCENDDHYRSELWVDQVDLPLQRDEQEKAREKKEREWTREFGGCMPGIPIKNIKHRRQ